MDKLMDYVCKELETLEQKIEKNGGLSPIDLQNLDTMTRAKKNLKKLEKMDEEYSHDGYSREGSYRRSYRGSYAEPTMPISNMDRYSGRRDSMGRYSRDEGYSRAESEELIDELRSMMSTMPVNTRRELEQLIKRYE